MVEQEVFKANFFMTFILPIIITVGILVVYFAVDGIPPWILALLIIPVVFAVTGQRTKLIVENGMLRYEKVFGGEEVSLKNVSQIMMREVETIIDKNPDSFTNNQQRQSINRNVNQVNQERKVEKIFYVLDESGRTIFSFPANMVSFRDRRRFEEAISASNPNIQVF